MPQAQVLTFRVDGPVALGDANLAVVLTRSSRWKRVYLKSSLSPRLGVCFGYISTWNAILDAVRYTKAQRVFDTDPLPANRDLTIIKVRNDTGADVPRYGVLGLDDPLILPSDNEIEFQRIVACSGGLPMTGAHEGKFAVALEPIAPDKIGQAAIAGVVPVKVLVDPGDLKPFADIQSGSTGRLADADHGSARILWLEEGEDEERWAIVRLGDGTGTSSADRGCCVRVLSPIPVAGRYLGQFIEPNLADNPSSYDDGAACWVEDIMHKQLAARRYLGRKAQGLLGDHPVAVVQSAETNVLTCQYQEHAIGADESSNYSPICCGPDGRVWTTLWTNGSSAKDFVAACTPQGVVTTYGEIPVGTQVRVFGIGLGLDGNLYLFGIKQTSPSPSWIRTLWRVVPATGTVTELANLGSASAISFYSTPICTDSHGDLWLTDRGTLRKFNLDGTQLGSWVLESFFTVGLSGCCAGPDGNIWATSFHRNEVYKVALDGTLLATYTHSGSQSFYPCVGADGNLWLTEGAGSSSGLVHRITPDGTITSLPPPWSGHCLGPCLGSDGKVWFRFDQGLSHYLASVTTSGEFSRCVVTSLGAAPMFSCAGPDGNVWLGKWSHPNKLLIQHGGL